MRIVGLGAVVLATLLCGVQDAGGQELPCPPVPLLSANSAAQPDLVIRATARVDEVRFERDPRVEVNLPTCSPFDTVRVTERRNLPSPVEPGVTYANVLVGVEILGHIDVRCLLPSLSSAVRGAGVVAGAAERNFERLCRDVAAIGSRAQ